MPTISDCLFIALVATPIDCAMSVVKAVRRALWSRQRGYAVWVPGEGWVSWHQAKSPMQAICKEARARGLGVLEEVTLLEECETRKMTRLEWEETKLEAG